MSQVELKNADTSTNYNSIHATVDNIYVLNANELIPMLNRLSQAAQSQEIKDFKNLLRDGIAN